MLHSPPPNVILIGASVRAAAASALRAGLTPWCVDLFADADLERMATVQRVAMETYPEGLLACMRDGPPAPVVYTGALENRPDLLARIDRPLWGNEPDVVRRIRTPELWTACLQNVGLACPNIRNQSSRQGRWLLKPRRSGAGHGIRFHTGEDFNPRTHFLQEWIDGPPCSAIFVGDNHRAKLLAVTQQVIGSSWLHTSGFRYAGNIGPLSLDSFATAHWQVLGDTLASAFQLRGLFGIDAIVRDGIPFPVEINPRYTASVEVIERATGLAAFELHRRVFQPSTEPTAATDGIKQVVGKAILYARQSLAFPSSGPWCESLEFADLPHEGDIIEVDQPVLTFFATATSETECLANLQEKAQTLDRALWG